MHILGFFLLLLSIIIVHGEIKDNENSVLYVGGNEKGNFSSIQNAINNAKNGDTIYVYKGVYNESIRLHKQIYLIGERVSCPQIMSGKNCY